MAVAVQEEKVVVVLPDFTDSDQVAQFCIVASEHQGTFGLKGLSNLLRLYLKHVHVGESQLTRIKDMVSRFNGERTPAQHRGMKVRSLRQTALAFFESLSTAGLRQQSKLYNVDYDQYDSQEEVIAQLVVKYLEMQG